MYYLGVGGMEPMMLFPGYSEESPRFCGSRPLRVYACMYVCLYVCMLFPGYSEESLRFWKPPPARACMCVCMCKCMYVCMYVCMLFPGYSDESPRFCGSRPLRVYVRMYVCMFLRPHVKACARPCMFEQNQNMYLYMYLCTYLNHTGLFILFFSNTSVLTYTCMYAYISVHT
jgi:hypothetical protein